MAAQPLTHHEIMALAAPFARSGRQVDLAASDRLARQLVFRPRPLAGESALSERLRLEDGERTRHRLVREIALSDGLAARLRADGDDPAELLALVDAVPPAAQWRRGEGWTIALGQRVTRADDGSVRVTIATLEAQVAGLRLSVTLPAVAGITAEVELEAPGLAALPDDLLAVLGGGWSSLWRLGERWRGQFRAPRREPARSEAALLAMQQAVAHLALTLAEPPARFHERLAAARWRVAVRRCVPLLAALGLIGLSFVVTSMDFARDSVWRMLIFNAPPILLALGVSLQELPRFEWPRWPRASQAASWQAAGPDTPAR